MQIYDIHFTGGMIALIALNEKPELQAGFDSLMNLHLIKLKILNPTDKNHLSRSTYWHLPFTLIIKKRH